MPIFARILTVTHKHTLPRYPHQKGFKPLPTVTEGKRREIFALLSVLPLIDAALLRRLRLELNWGGSELEYFVWQHPEVRNNGLGIYFPKQIAESYHPYYPKDTAEKFWQIVNQHHAKAFHGLKCLEGLNQYAKEQKTSIDIKTYFQQLCATLHQTSEHSPRYSALQAQAKTVIALVSKDIFDTELNDTIHHIAAFAYAEEISAENWQPLLSLGLECKKLLWKLSAEQRQFRNWFIVQQGQGQFVCIKSDTLPLLNIVTVSGMLPPVYIENSKELVLEQHSVTLAENETVLIKTDLQVLELKAIKKPSWALSIGRDQQGLFVTVPWLDEPRLYWQNPTPERFVSGAIGMAAIGEVPINADYYIPAQEQGRWAGHDFIGVDKYGLYADLTIENITQRLRWIEPGTFLMGSPETEAERFDDEIQHQVTLTEGYWLADSTVTQALWQAVMGNNPSEFKDDMNNPVENVSWNDAQQFINRLNNLLPDIQAKLPSEAQWEYACRAGTTTPFSFGNNISPEQVNYNGDDPYAGGEKGLYREKTVPVKSLPANPWGLYEMHGNVWEWCQDNWNDTLSSEPTTDPIELNTGSMRVVRGGSWGNDGRFVRSADRNGFSADDRNDSIGLRFALGLQA